MSEFAEYSNPRSHDLPLKALGMIVRTAREADVAELARITQEREGGETARHHDSLRSFLQGAGHILVADFKGEIVGFGKTAYLRQSADAPTNCIPEGWYLAGVIVRPAFRRRGVAHELTRSRIEWLTRRTSVVYYVASAQNTVTIALHKHFGFVEIARDIHAPGVSFAGGVGLLFELKTGDLPNRR